MNMGLVLFFGTKCHSSSNLRKKSYLRMRKHIVGSQFGIKECIISLCKAILIPNHVCKRSSHVGKGHQDMIIYIGIITSVYAHR